MASTDPSSISDIRKKTWVDEISKIFNHLLKIDVEPPPVSIFRVPESITTQKPQAYEPQQIGLGPYHHFRPQLYEKVEHKKLAAMRRVLKNHNINEDFEVIVLDKVMKLVPVVRECYDMFLQDDNDSLAWVFAMDGLFLLDLFCTYNLEYENKGDPPRSRKNASDQYTFSAENDMDSDNCYILIHEEDRYLRHHKRPEVDPKRRLLAQDIMMLENQIPFMVLKEINKSLYASSGDSFYSSYDFSPSIFRSFTEIHSPLELCSPSKAPAHVEHLLHYLYHSIVNNVRMEHRFFGPADSLGFLINVIFQLCAKPFKFITKLPRDAIVQIYEQTVTILETFSQSKTIIPSASKLHKRAGFRFHQLWKDEGIRNIDVDIYGKMIYLPCVTLNHDSEVTLRNLVAYEMSLVNTNNFPLTEFVALMCALVVNVNDVKLLQKENIIEGGLEADEVIKLFTSMRSSIPSITTKEKSKLQTTIDEVNSVYQSTLTIQIVLFFRKIANGLLVVLRAIGGFVEASWKIVAFVASIASVAILIGKTYCEVYGCDNTTKTLTFAPR